MNLLRQLVKQEKIMLFPSTAGLGTPYFKNADTLRFLAFLSVFLSHTLRLPSTNNSTLEFMVNLLMMNYLGVPFFFSLSSFLITYRLLAEKKDHQVISLKKFYRNRILRIWPAYFLIVLIGFVVLPAAAKLLQAKPPTLPDALPFFFFYVNFYIIQKGEFFTFALAILWSISIEEQFYAVWGIVMKYITRQALPFLLLALFAGSVIFSYWYINAHHGRFNNLAIHSIFIIQNFCTGALAAFIFKKPAKYLTAFCAGAYIVLPVCYLFTDDIILMNIIKSTCYGFILYDQCLNPGRLFNAGRLDFLNYLGKISYGLYLYHALVIVILQTQFQFFIPPSLPLHTMLLQSITALAVTIITAHISYRYFELKFLALKKITHFLYKA